MVVGPTACCWCVFSWANITCCIPWIYSLDQKWRFFFSCVSLHLCCLPPSTVSPPVRPTARFFSSVMCPENAVTFHFMHVTGRLLSCFHPSSSTLPSELFWNVSRDKPELHSSIPKNLGSWLHCEHLPKIGHQRLLHSPNASSSGHRCALYCQNLREEVHLLCGHRHTAQYKLSLFKIKRWGWIAGISVSTHGIVASTAPPVKDHTSSYPCLTELCWQKCFCLHHRLLPEFSL